MADWLSSDVTFDGIRMHYYRTGGDKPPLVLNHGATDDGLCWTPTARALESEFDVIMPDALGHGLSDDSDGPANSEQRGQHLAGFIRALGLDKPIVGGHSMGAGSTMYMAALYPELPSRIVLEDPGLWRPLSPAEQSTRAATMTKMRENMLKMRKMTRDELIEFCRNQSPTWAEEELGPWADSKLRVRPSVDFTRSVEPALTWQQVFQRITCPTLLITSDPGLGGIVSPEAAAEAKELMPALRVVNIKGAGHNIRRERFTEFLAAVREFVGK